VTLARARELATEARAKLAERPPQNPKDAKGAHRRLHIRGVRQGLHRSKQSRLEEREAPRSVAHDPIGHQSQGRARNERLLQVDYRRGDMREKRRKLMEAWAAYCTEPKAGKIVQFSQR
jgi:hypothetical protein